MDDKLDYNEFKKWSEEHQKEHKKLDELLVESRVRFENGTKAFEEIRNELHSHRPKPLPVWQMFISGVGLLVTILSAWWALSSMFAERPTASEVRDTLEAHAKSEHPATAARQAELQHEQTEQKLLMNNLMNAQQQMNRDLAEIKADVKIMRRGR